MAMHAVVFAPGSIGNVGPGFDVLGLCVGGIGDTVAIELHDRADVIDEVKGWDAAQIPREVGRNSAAIAARAFLDAHGAGKARFRMAIDKGLRLSAGMGGSAASSVAGALAAARAVDQDASPIALMTAAMAGEAVVSGRHIDNIAATLLGGLTIVRTIEPIDVIKVPLSGEWWIALVTPEDVRIETRVARALLPETSPRADWVQQMANTAALVHALATGNRDLVRRALDDRFAEPRRASLIPGFAEVKQAALRNGALGCSISGSGPTVFALAGTEEAAQRSATAMQAAFGALASMVHVGRVSDEGARERP
jgi:homoserine kinase